MKKKVLALLLCAMMTASLIACGKSDEQSSEGSTSQGGTSQDNDQQQQEEVTPEALPEAFAHITFDEGANEGYKVVVNVDDGSVAAPDGASKAIVESSDVLGHADGPVGQALYLDGKHGLDLNLKATNTDTWTVSYWMNADRLGTFGATLCMGHNIGRAADAGNNVTWFNITQSEWGADGAQIFPIVWSRNEASNAQDGTVCWPWMYSWDDSIHGKKEWVMITLVSSGEQQAGPLGTTTCGAQFYVNGNLVYDSADNFENGTYFEYTWDASLAPNIMQPGSSQFESYFGINYWDIIYRGFVDDLWVFDTALNAGQVASLYALGDPNVTSVAPETVEAEPEPAEPVLSEITPDGSAIASIGSTDRVLGWWSEWSDSVAIADGESKTVVMNNYSNGGANWNNYVVAFTNTETGNGVAPSADNYAGYAEYAVVRADLFGWGDAAYAGTFEGSWGDDWAAFASMMTDADVTLTISRSGSDVTIDATIVGADEVTYTSKSVITSTLTADAPCYFFITGEGAYIEILSVE